MTSLFEDQARIARLPAPIAEAVRTMLAEITSSGEQTTADETVDAIEATLSHLGRCWVAEYLAAGAPDPELNRDLYDALARKITVGAWVAIARRIRRLFTARGTDTVMHDLGAIEFGEPGDMAHPVARLVAYRNSFGHGSLQAVVEDIREHRHLLEALITALPAFWEQPVHVRDEEGGWLLATGEWPRVDPPPLPEEPEPFHPLVLGSDGRFIDFYPLYYLGGEEGRWRLACPSPRERRHPMARLYERQTLADWYRRYQRERAGHLDFTAVLQTRAAGQTAPTPAVRAQLRDALQGPGNLVLIRAHPGCGKASASLAALEGDLVAGDFADIFATVVEPRGLGQSGLAVANLLLRRIENATGRPEHSYDSAGEDVLAGLKQALADLAASGKRLLLIIEDLHVGAERYRGEPLRVLDVYKRLAGAPVTVLATVWPGAVTEPVLFDTAIDWPVPPPEAVDQVRVRQAVERLRSGGPVGARRDAVLRTVCADNEPVTLFSVCDAYEAGNGGCVFEPQIERDLLHLRPVLATDRDPVTRERRWWPFAPVLATVPES